MMAESAEKIQREGDVVVEVSPSKRKRRRTSSSGSHHGKHHRKKKHHAKEKPAKACDECGTVFENDAVRFCGGCGAKRGTEAAPKKKQATCSNCGLVLEGKNKFCMACGTPRDDD